MKIAMVFRVSLNYAQVIYKCKICQAVINILIVICHLPLFSPPVLNRRVLDFWGFVAETLLCTFELPPIPWAGDCDEFAEFISFVCRPWLFVICRKDKLLPDLDSASNYHYIKQHLSYLINKIYLKLCVKLIVSFLWKIYLKSTVHFGRGSL